MGVLFDEILEKLKKDSHDNFFHLLPILNLCNLVPFLLSAMTPHLFHHNLAHDVRTYFVRESVYDTKLGNSTARLK